MDRVFIEGLEVDTVIGAYDWERSIRQCLRLDLSFAWDNRPAAAGDDLTLALDYASVSSRIQAFAEQAQFQLVETFAERLVEAVREDAVDRAVRPDREAGQRAGLVAVTGRRRRCTLAYGRRGNRRVAGKGRASIDVDAHDRKPAAAIVGSMSTHCTTA